MELDRGIVEWIEALRDGRVVRVEHQGRWRPHFFVEVELNSGTTESLLVRMVRDPEFVPLSQFLSHFDLAHEARILTTLQDVPIKVPHTYGFHEDPPAIVMERVGGTNELKDITPARRDAVMREYIRNLHKLHSVEADEHLAERLKLQLPSNSTELAFAQISYVESDYRQAVPFIGAEPLIDFALWWLKSNVPVHRQKPRWIQGDTGPGQFMADDSGLTALIDWELSHLGDPMLDIGVMRMRNTLYPVGNLSAYLDYYAELAGEPLDGEAVRFYTVMTTLLSPMGMAAAIQNPTTAMKSMLPMLAWDVTLRRGLCDALAEAHGIEIALPDLPRPPESGRTDLHLFLVEFLTTHCSPLGQTDHDALLLDGAIGLAETNRLISTIGVAMEADDLDDIELLLGERPLDRSDGLARLAAIIENGPHDLAVELIWLFTRMEHRREHLWRPLMVAQDSVPLERLYPSTRTVDLRNGMPFRAI